MFVRVAIRAGNFFVEDQQAVFVHIEKGILLFQWLLSTYGNRGNPFFCSGEMEICRQLVAVLFFMVESGVFFFDTSWFSGIHS